MVSSSSSCSSQVNIISKCFVKPKTISEKSKEPHHLSPLDHVVLQSEYMQKGLLFLKPSTISESDDSINPKDFMETWLQKLKDSLATALVHFYPLGGRLSTLKTEDSYSVFVDCSNSPGAGFIPAKSNLSVGDIVGSKYVPLVVQSFFDHHKAVNLDGHTMSLLSLKVTELVDGVFIGMSMNHSIGDGTSFWQFYNSLSEIFNSQEEEETIDNNNLFCLKNPPIFRQVFTGPIHSLPFSQRDELISQFESPVLKERMFHCSSETVRSLKSKVNQDCGTTKISSLQSLTAFLWRSITRARKLPNDQETTCRLVSDNRSRMNPPLSMTYFGVCVSPVKTTAESCDLLKNEFGWAASRLHQAVAEHTSKMLSFDMDRWLKSLSASQFDPHSDLNIVHIGSSPRFNKYGCEFGMGKAVAVRSGYNGKYDGKITVYPGREGGGSIDLEVCLLPEFMDALESDPEFMSLVSSS